MVLDSILHQYFPYNGLVCDPRQPDHHLRVDLGIRLWEGREFEISHQQCLEFLDDSLMGLLLNACQHFFLQRFQFLRKKEGLAVSSTINSSGTQTTCKRPKNKKRRRIAVTRHGNRNFPSLLL